MVGVASEQAYDPRDGMHPARILVVEDEPLIAMMLADMLEELGFAIVASHTHVAPALEYLGQSDVDIALLDVNLGDEKIDPIADLLAARARPFIFTTGYGRTGVPPIYANRPVLQKPFQISDLETTLREQLKLRNEF